MNPEGSLAAGTATNQNNGGDTGSHVRPGPELQARKEAFATTEKNTLPVGAEATSDQPL